MSTDTQNDDSKLGKGFLIGLITGSALGALFALLYAPKSGREMRSDLRVKRDELMAKAGELVGSATATAEDLINQARSRADDLVSSARDQAGTILGDADRIMSGARERAGDIVDSAKQSAGKVQSAAKAGVESFREELKRPS